MIPKIIHYCWFGGNDFPDKMKFCIDSWKKLNGFQLMLWHEKTFDVNSCVFTKEAYARRKFAFVSDYVRIYALVNYGGIYMDTDIEVIKDFSSLMENHKILLGSDEGGYLTAFMGAEKEQPFFKEILAMYQAINFVRPDGSLETTVNNKWLEECLLSHGYVRRNIFQELPGGIAVYPDDYFHAKSLTDGKYHITENTYCIHHHTLSWVSWKTRLIYFLRMKLFAPLLGRKYYSALVGKIKRKNS